MSCLFIESIKNGHVDRPMYLRGTECKAPSVEACADCCAITGAAIDSTKRDQTLLESLNVARKGDSSGMYLGLLAAISDVEEQSGKTLL